MKAQLLCLPCTLRTAYDVATKATGDARLQKKIILETARWIADHPDYSEASPPILHTEVCRIAKRLSGNPDPFSYLKRVSNEGALKVLPVLEREAGKLRSFREVFQLAVRGAICGNVIDFEVQEYGFRLEDLRPTVLSCLESRLAIDDTARFMGLLSKSKKVLYLLDNAGEIVFDKFLVKTMREGYPCAVLAVVKEKPVLNDATMADAEQVNFTEVAEVITTGNDCVGVRLEGSSKEFQNHLKTADLIVAKGQGHYESVTDIGPTLASPVCYLLRAKCSLVAKDLGVPINSNVVKVMP